MVTVEWSDLFVRRRHLQNRRVGASQNAYEFNISSETQKIYVLKAIQFLIEDVIMFYYDVIAVFGQSLAWSRPVMERMISNFK